jgi:hypothetical protein
MHCDVVGDTVTKLVPGDEGFDVPPDVAALVAEALAQQEV